MPARHVVVDGSNMATEGSSLPSLQQLDEAVREYLIENPDDSVTVVVDATFGHRIPPEERKRFEQAESAGEIVSPPAGAIGRGDAFLLRVADKVGAVVLSNDSFQEFHGEYEWLFDKGRLMGGKPVPGVGWIFTPRTPVRGPKSRESVKEAKRKRHAEKVEEPAPESGLELVAERSRGHGGDRKLQRAIAAAVEEAVEPAKGGRKRRPRRRGGEVPSEPLNEPFSFITFIAAHQLGDEVEGTVEEFSSHGAFVSVEGARCYVPLSAMSDVPPRSAREVLRKAEKRVFVVQAFDAMRRGIELALPGFARPAGIPTPETIDAEIHRGEADLDLTEGPAPDRPGPERGIAKARGASKLAKKSISAQQVATKEAPRPTKAASKRAVGQSKPSPAAKRPAAAKAVSPNGEAAAKAADNKSATDKSAPDKSVADRSAVNRSAANRSPANRSPAKEPSLNKVAALKTAPGPAKEPVPPARGRTEPSRLAVAKATPEGQKSPARKSPARKSPARKSPARKSPAEKQVAEKQAAQKELAQKQPAQKEPATTAVGADGARRSSQTRGSPAAKAVAAKSSGAKSGSVRTSDAGPSPAEKAPSARKRPAASSTSGKSPAKARAVPTEKSRGSGPTVQNSRATKTSSAKASPARKTPSATRLTTGTS